MLRIFKHGHGEYANWKIGEGWADKSNRYIFSADYIIVDKDELSWVLNTIVGIPYHRTNDPQMWTGDIARFIVSNIPKEAPEIKEVES